MLAIKRAPADHETQAWDLGSTLRNIWIWHFIIGGILWLYQTQGLFIISSPDTNVTEDSHSDCSLTAGHEKKQQRQLTHSYSLFLNQIPELVSVVPVLYLYLLPYF